jgi:hypothetical protein
MESLRESPISQQKQGRWGAIPLPTVAALLKRGQVIEKLN